MLAGAKAINWTQVAEEVNQHGPQRKPLVSRGGDANTDDKLSPSVFAVQDCQKTWQDTMARRFGVGKTRDRKRKQP